MTTFYLIRHGQTEWNRERRIQGHLDVKLSEEGREQALRAGQALQGEGIEYIYSSDLSRALETATIIAQELEMPVAGTLCDLREINFGDWEGMSIEQIAAEEPEAFAEWREDTVNRPVPGGESFGMMAKRVLKCIIDLGKKHPENKVAVVTHGGPIVYTLGWIMKLTLEEQLQIKIANCSISIVEYDPQAGEWEILKLNDTSHLD
ncbi:MAG: histidine phosphatase family protein [bacterium]|nr:histidine phosphatase family protein [Bacillota bacterium]